MTSPTPAEILLGVANRNPEAAREGLRVREAYKLGEKHGLKEAQIDRLQYIRANDGKPMQWAPVQDAMEAEMRGDQPVGVWRAAYDKHVAELKRYRLILGDFANWFQACTDPKDTHETREYYLEELGWRPPIVLTYRFFTPKLYDALCMAQWSILLTWPSMYCKGFAEQLLN